MAEQTGFVRENIEWVGSAIERLLPGELQREFHRRRKTFERQLAGGRRGLEKRTRGIERRARRRVEQLRSELGRLSLRGRAEQLRTGVERAFERSVDTVLGSLQIASKHELDRIDKKLGQMTRKLKAMERSRGNGHASA